MKRKSTRKLALHRESLRNLDPDGLKRVAGGLFSTSENCTQLCTNTHSDGGRSFCFCPECQTNTCPGVCN